MNNSKKTADILGFIYLFKGFKFLLSPGIKRYMMLPIVLNIILIGLGYYFGFTMLWQTLTNYFEGSNWGFLSYILQALAFIVGLFATFYLFTTITLIIGAPFYSLLSEKTEEIISNAPVNNMTTIDTIKDIPHMIGLEILKLAYRIPLIILSIICIFIPIIGPIITIFISAWINAMDYTSYGFENSHIPYKNTRYTLLKNKTLCLSFGAACWAVLLIPVLNLLFIPAAVCGGTILWYEKFKPNFEEYIKLNNEKQSLNDK